MKHRALFVFAFALVWPALAPAQFQPTGEFEEPPVLDASVILKPEYLTGPHFTVRREVPTYAGRNQYQIDSDFGAFEADGNAELAERVQEIRAIARLREVSLTDEYKRGFAKAAESPLLMAKGLITHPSKTITGVPKGLWKFMNRAGEALKDAGEERERSPYEERAGADLIGFSKAKRALALELKVDPYSSNEALQKELNAIAWTSYAGGVTVKLALAPVGGSAGLAVTAVNTATAAEQALRDLSPSDLRRASLAKLLAMSVSRESADFFLNGTAYSPTEQTLLVEALESLAEVGGREDFLRLASGAADGTDARFFRRTAQLIAQVHRQSPLSVIAIRGGFPVCLAKDGTAIVALEWDYAFHSRAAAQFLQSIKTANAGNAYVKRYRAVLTGAGSPLVKKNLEELEFSLEEQALPGVLK